MKNEDILTFDKGEERQLTDNFKLSEFKCKCSNESCKTILVSQKHLNRLQELRNQVGPLMITSGYRCDAHNKAVGGSKRSQHVMGLACDIVPLEESIDRVAALAESIMDGIGIYKGKGFIHVDSRGTKARWNS